MITVQNKPISHRGRCFLALNVIKMSQKTPSPMAHVLLGESVFLAALLFWLFIMLPGTKRKNKYKAMTKGRNITPERTIRFYQDHMSVIARTGETTDIGYQEITGWQETDNLYILNCTNKRSVLVSKDGFTFGSLDVIKSFFPDNN